MEREKIKILSDTATDKDLLNFSKYARLIAEVIKGCNEENTPLTIGIFGEQGCGKTSFLQMVEAELSQEEQVKTAWYIPLDKISANEPITPIIRAFLRNSVTYLERESTEAAQKISKDIIETFSRLISFRSMSERTEMGHLNGSSILIYDLHQSLKSLIADFVDTVAGNNNLLVTFIDDLDKCPIKEIISIFEDIYSYLLLPRCIFIFSLDHKAFINLYDKNISSNLLDAHSFLNKHISIPYFIPPLDDNLISSYLMKLNPESDIVESLPLLTQIIGRNPKYIKKFCNLLKINSYLYREKWKTLEEIAILTHIQLKWWEIFSEIIKYGNDYLKMLAHSLQLAKDQSAFSNVALSFPYATRNRMSEFLKNDDFKQFLKEYLPYFFHQGELAEAKGKEEAVIYPIEGYQNAKEFMPTGMIEKEVEKDEYLMEPVGVFTPDELEKSEKAFVERENKDLLTREQVSEIFKSTSNLGGLNLEGCDLRDINLRGVNLAGASLRRTIFQRANLRRGNFEDCDIAEADFSNANLMDANLKGVKGTGADFSGANLWGCKLNGASLSKANFKGANLRGASLAGADLTDANFMGAELIDADLSNANLNGIVVDQHTLMHFACFFNSQIDDKTREWISRKYRFNERMVLLPKSNPPKKI